VAGTNIHTFVSIIWWPAINFFIWNKKPWNLFSELIKTSAIILTIAVSSKHEIHILQIFLFKGLVSFRLPTFVKRRLFCLNCLNVWKNGVQTSTALTCYHKYLKTTDKMQCMLTFTLSELRSALKPENLICIVCVVT